MPLGLLARRWERAKGGEGQLVLIVGEPGLGKSRLLEEFHTRLTETPHTWVEWSASPNFHTTFSKFSFFQGVTAARRVVSTTGVGLAGLLLVRLMLPHRPPGCWAAARHRQPGRRDRHRLSPACAG